MSLDSYVYSTASSNLVYEFLSIGPNGNMRKVVRFHLQVAAEIAYYNLGFGDWNESKQEIDDLKISDNNDWERVLGTVALIVIHFTGHFPDSLIYIEGSTKSRTRLYQISINKFRADLDNLFEIFGLKNGEGWETFQVNQNYDAFLIKRKVIALLNN